VRTGTGGTTDVEVDAIVAATSCRDPVAMAAPCGGSLAAAVLSVTRGALYERRLVDTDVSDLSALAGARAGTVGATLQTRRQKIELRLLETRTSGEATAYLKVEKPRFLFLEGSTSTVAAAVVTTAALPDVHGARRRLRGTPPLLWAARRQVLPHPPRAPAPLPPLQLLMRGARDSTSQGDLPPVALLFFLLTRRRVLRSRRRIKSLLLA
jgi:hypothetical protein